MLVERYSGYCVFVLLAAGVRGSKVVHSSRDRTQHALTAGPGEVDWRQLVMVVGSEMLSLDEACTEAVHTEGSACSGPALHHPSPKGERDHMRSPIGRLYSTTSRVPCQSTAIALFAYPNYVPLW